jgi:BirA family transcriptional regulator, biotin operon repressor / biotin---[acetyl-CoA-carboxylase] ligase
MSARKPSLRSMTVPVMPRYARVSKDSGHERDAHATFELARLAKELKPFKLHWFPTLGSTNSHAARMRREGRLVAPCAVLTGRQTAGRGRGVNVWHAAGGVVTVTFVLPASDTLPPQHVPLIAGLAVRDAIAEFGVPDVGIKWPNDLWHDDRKLAGLLCERLDRVDLIGVGVNVNVSARQLPRALRASATSLLQMTGRPIDQTSLVAAVARHLRRRLGDSRTSLASCLGEIQRADVLRDRLVRVTQTDAPLEGRALGIDSLGRLMIRARHETRMIVTGTVRPVV